MSEAGAAVDYHIRLEHDHRGWRALILEAGGSIALSRACATEYEARTFASTVEQHLAWLSSPRFREYYRLREPGVDPSQGEG